MGAQRWAYIGRTKKPLKHHPIAGTVVSAVVDDGECADMVSDALRDWIKDDLIIERVPVEWVREHLFTAQPYVPTP